MPPKTYLTQWQQLKPPLQLPPCPHNTFHTVPTPQTPFPIASMPSQHISHSANTSTPLSNCLHALTTHFTQCQHLKPRLQLTPCPQNIFHPVPTPQTPFPIAPLPSEHILPHANTSNPLSNCLHALKTYYSLCQHLKPPFSTASIPSKHISPSANTSNPVCNSPHALKTYFTQCGHLKPPFSTAPMPSQHVSPSAKTSNSLFD